MGEGGIQKRKRVRIRIKKEDERKRGFAQLIFMALLTVRSLSCIT